MARAPPTCAQSHVPYKVYLLRSCWFPQAFSCVLQGLHVSHPGHQVSRHTPTGSSQHIRVATVLCSPRVPQGNTNNRMWVEQRRLPTRTIIELVSVSVSWWQQCLVAALRLKSLQAPYRASPHKAGTLAYTGSAHLYRAHTRRGCGATQGGWCMPVAVLTVPIAVQTPCVVCHGSSSASGNGCIRAL
jgi:hypothetical protein